MIELKSTFPFDDREERDSFSIVVRNTTTSTVYANVLGATTNLKDNSNATISYSYNLSGETFATNSITIEYKTTNQPTFQTATLPLNQQNIEGVVFALNQLGIGTWFYSGNDVITYNNNYVFGTLGVTAATTYAGQINILFDTGIGSGFNGAPSSIVQQNDGKLIVSGLFTLFNFNIVNFIVRLNADGTYDPTFATGTGFNSQTENLIIQPDGKIIVIGTFTSFNGNPANGIVRLNTNGSYDATFITGTGLSGTPYDIKLQTDGKIIVAGSIITYNGNPAVGIVRINTNGSYDPTFNTAIGTGVGLGFALAIQTDGKIILGGGFSTYNGVPASRIVRINTNGSIDATFNTAVGADNTVFDVIIQSDGKIVAGGAFTTYNGNSSDGIVRINTNASYDATFNVGSGFAGGNVEKIAIQSNGKFIVIGNITIYNGNVIPYIVRINTDGSYDNTFNSGSGFTFGGVALIYNGTNNTITVGGGFFTYDGVTVNGIVQIYTVSPA